MDFLCPRCRQQVQEMEGYPREQPLPPSSFHFFSHIINAMPPCPLPAPKEALEQNAINNISVILSTLISTHLGKGTRIYTESEKF